VYLPTAVAHHVRTSRGLGSRRYAAALGAFHRNEREKPDYVRRHSITNQWLMLLKNEDVSNFLLDLPFIVARELLVLGYNTVFAPGIAYHAVPAFAHALFPTLEKRRAIKRRQVISPRNLRKWFMDGPKTQRRA
jgi:hypothetical protein